MERSLVANAADASQVKKAGTKVQLMRDRELNDIRVVLSTVEGRRFAWRLLGECKTFASVWEASAKIHYNAGRQDLGHFIMSEVTDANVDLLFKMMTENKKGES